MERLGVPEVADAVFFWVPKCAGTSIYKLLVRHGCPESRWEDPLVPFANRGLITFGHVHVPDLLGEGVVSAEYLERAFKFAFVRNPFDRLVSLYFYLRRIRCPDVPGSMDFAGFCRAVEERTPRVGLFNYRGLSQCNPMAAWLVGKDGRLLVDEVGRFENLEADFARIGERIGIRSPLPHENRGSRADYRLYYNRESRAMVERFFHQDLAHFGYGF